MRIIGNSELEEFAFLAVNVLAFFRCAATSVSVNHVLPPVQEKVVPISFTEISTDPIDSDVILIVHEIICFPIQC
jgi:hypothetical protein